MSHNNQINNLLGAFREMLEELTQEELDTLEDFIVNKYCVDNTDENDDYPNLFLDIIQVDDSTAEYLSWNPDFGVNDEDDDDFEDVLEEEDSKE